MIYHSSLTEIKNKKNSFLLQTAILIFAITLKMTNENIV